MSETTAPERMDAYAARNRIIEWFSTHEMDAWSVAEHGGDRGTLCVYRGAMQADSQQRCAAGCLIPDELYDPRMETKSFLAGPPGVWEKVEDLFTNGGRYFVGGAQSLHDGMVEDAYRAGEKPSTEKFIERLREMQISPS